MSLRRSVFSRGMKVLNHPRVQKLLSHPRTMDAFVAAVRMKDRLGDALADARRRLAHAVGLATKQEIKDLKKLIRDLEKQLRDLAR